MKKMIAAILTATLTFTVPAFATEAPKETAEATDTTQLTDEEYKAVCTEMWYDDLIFGKRKELVGKDVKLDLFVEESGHFDPFKVSASYLLDSLINDNELGMLFLTCGVMRPDTYSYVGEPITILAKANSDCLSYVIGGDHLTLYGNIAECQNNVWTGKNVVYVIARVVENRGQ